MPSALTQQVLNKLDAFGTDLGNMKVLVAAHLEREKSTDEKVEKMAAKFDKFYVAFVEGNGKPAIKEMVADHEQWIADQKKKAELKDERSWQVKLRVIAEGLAIGSLLITNIIILITKQ